MMQVIARWLIRRSSQSGSPIPNWVLMRTNHDPKLKAYLDAWNALEDQLRDCKADWIALVARESSQIHSVQANRLVPTNAARRAGHRAWPSVAVACAFAALIAIGLGALVAEKKARYDREQALAQNEERMRATRLKIDEEERMLVKWTAATSTVCLRELRTTTDKWGKKIQLIGAEKLEKTMPSTRERISLARVNLNQLDHSLEHEGRLLVADLRSQVHYFGSELPRRLLCTYTSFKPASP